MPITFLFLFSPPEFELTSYCNAIRQHTTRPPLSLVMGRYVNYIVLVSMYRQHQKIRYVVDIDHDLQT